MPKRIQMARGQVWKIGRTWHYRVIDSTGKVVFADNTNRWQPIFDDCYRRTSALRVIEEVHTLEKSYAQLVDEASIYL